MKAQTQSNIVESEIFLSSSHGIYIPKLCVEQLDINKIQGIRHSDLEVLKNVDDEDYWEIWDYFLCNASVELEGRTWRFEINENNDLVVYTMDKYIL